MNHDFDRRIVLPALAAITVVAGTAACRDERSCLVNADCPDDRVCVANSCLVPECRAHGQCGEGFVCERYACVDGCLEPHDCELPQVCLEQRCRDVSESCGCALAPEVCGMDINPHSNTNGQNICLPSFSPTGVAMFFGSVRCSICKQAFAALLAVRDDLKSEGYEPALVFVQDKQRVVDSATVGSELAPSDSELEPSVFHEPVNAVVIHDNDALGIWKTYSANWYTLMIVSREGCLAEVYRSVSRSKLVEGGLANDVHAAWRAAMTQDCQ